MYLRHLQWRHRTTKIDAIGFVLLSFLLIGLRLHPKPLMADLIPNSTAIYAADGNFLRLTLASDNQYQLWTPLESIQPKAIEAVKLYEDRYFSWHWGVNPAALLRGAWRLAPRCINHYHAAGALDLYDWFAQH